MVRSLIFVHLSVFAVVLLGCNSQLEPGEHSSNDTDADNDSDADGDSDNDSDGDSDGDSDNDSDTDGDSDGDSDTDTDATECIDGDQDGWCEPIDCDDDDPNTYPNADENEGDGVDNDCDGLTDEPDVNPDTESHSYIWIANTLDGTLSKVNTQTAIEEARYATCSLGNQCDPSRTSVNMHGDMVVTNRSPGGGAVASTVVKFAASLDDCIDKDTSGSIETSTGPADVLAWNEDECMLWSTELAGTGQGARATAWDGQENPGTGTGGHVFVGTCTLGVQQTVYKIDGDTGEIVGLVNINSQCAYGGAIGPDRGFWIESGYGTPDGQLIRVGIENLDVTYKSHSCGYGISVDSSGRIWAGGYHSSGLTNCVSIFDPTAGTEQTVNVPEASFLRGIAVGVEKSADYVWAADTSGRLFKLSEAPPAVVTNYTVGAGAMIGVAVDFEGYVWTVDQGANTAYKFDPDTETFITVNIGSGPYTYSDMTGVQLANVVVQ
jgi:hypothetical protein